MVSGVIRWCQRLVVSGEVSWCLMVAGGVWWCLAVSGGVWWCLVVSVVSVMVLPPAFLLLAGAN